jgi:hypothetical protein
MGSDSSRWTEITSTQFPWEREALDYVRERLPDHDPYRAFALFEFIASDGSINEVDLLAIAPTGISWGALIRSSCKSDVFDMQLSLCTPRANRVSEPTGETI